MITIYGAGAKDFSTNGLGALAPESCIVKETLNGTYEVTLQHGYDEAGKYQRLQEGNILRVPVPAGKTPYIRMNAAAAVSADIYKVTTDGRQLRIRSGPGLDYRVLGAYKPGAEVTVIDRESNAEWSEVTTPDGKHGWMWSGNLEYVRTETTAEQAEETIREAVQLRDQPFRIYRIVPTLTGMTVYARHIFYDLMDNMVGEYKPEKTATGASAFKGLAAATMSEHEFAFYSDLDTTAEDVEIIDKNPAAAILDSDGLIDHYGGELMRDWFDVYLAKRVGEETQYLIREGKNLTGISYSVDVTNVATRIIPKGTDADGNPLYLPETKYIDGANIDSYPTVKWYVLEVKDAKEKTSGDDQRTKEECYTLMREAAQKAFDEGADLPDVTLNVDFIECADTEEYRKYKFLQSVSIGDTVRVVAPRVGLAVAMRMTQYTYNCLTKQYEKMTLGTLDATIEGNMINPRSIGSGAIAGSKIKLGGIGSGQLADGAVNSLKIGLAAIEYAHIKEATINQLDANAITAIRADIRKLVAEEITTDQLYADLATIATAQITAANIERANIQWAEIETLVAEIADIAVAEITTANIEKANIDWASITNLNATVAAITTAQIANAKIGWAQIDGVKVETAQIALGAITSALIEQGAVGTAQIADSSITEAKIVSLNADVIKTRTLSADRLIVKGENGLFYEINATAGGLTAAQLTQEQYKNAISGTALVAKSVTADQIAAKTITANEILAGTITAAEIDVANLFAAQATITALTNYLLKASTIEALQGELDVWAQDKINIAVGGIRVGSTQLMRATKTFSTDEGWRLWNCSVYGYASGAWPEHKRLQQSRTDSEEWQCSAGSPLIALPDDWQGRELTLSAYLSAAAWADVDKGVAWTLCLSDGTTTRGYYHSKYNIVKAGQAQFGSDAEHDRQPQAGKLVRAWTRFRMDEAEFTKASDTAYDFAGCTHMFVQFWLRQNGDVRTAAPKLEWGNKPTEWSYAPEDTDAGIEAVRSELTITAGEIRGEVEDEIAGVNTTISQTASDIRAEVKDEVDGLNSTISQTAEEISLSVAGIAVGGRNMLRNTGDLKISNYAFDASGATAKGTYVEVDDGLKITCSSANVRWWLGSIPVTPGRQYAVSVRYKIISGEAPIQFQYVYRNSSNTAVAYGGSASTQTQATLDGWTVLSDVLTVPSDTSITNVRLAVRTGKDYALYDVVYQICKPKFEVGNRATDWTLHPEEFQAGSSVVIDKDQVSISTAEFSVSILDEDGVTNMLTIDKEGAYMQSLEAPNVAPRYDGPATLYVNPSATSAQIAAGSYYRSLKDVFSVLSRRWVARTVTVNLAAGMTEYGTIELVGVSGGGQIKITGSSTSPAKLVGRLNLYYNSSPVSISYLNVDATTVGIMSEGAQWVSISNCTITGPGTGVSGTYGIYSLHGSSVTVTSCELYDFYRSMYGMAGGTVDGYGCKGNCRVGANRTSLHVSGRMPCDSTTWTVAEYAGKVHYSDITVDQGSKPTPETAPTTVSYSMVNADNYTMANGSWTNYSDEDIRQGYTSAMGMHRGCFWFDNATIRSALKGKTIKSATLSLYQLAAGRNQPVQVNLEGITMEYSGRTGVPYGTQEYGVIGTTAGINQATTFTIPTQVITDLVAGTINGLMVRNDESSVLTGDDNSYHFAKFAAGTTTANRPVLTVAYT